MKLSTLKSEVTVPKTIKQFALLLAILEQMYAGEREKTIKHIARYYGVTL